MDLHAHLRRDLKNLSRVFERINQSNSKRRLSSGIKDFKLRSLRDLFQKVE
jgi:hypothetical protein